DHRALHSFPTRRSSDLFMAITPSWFFSYGMSFRKSGFSHDNLSWIKRQENNQQVMNHFRFVAAWLSAMDNTDLFSDKKRNDAFRSEEHTSELQSRENLV